MRRRRYEGRQRKQGDDGAEVEQQRRPGGEGELVRRVQHAGDQRGEADEQQIGEGDSGQFHHQVEAHGLIHQARG
jgi:hypothetical protein